MIVISDTSAITSLLQIGKESILQRLFHEVTIPPAVRDELLIFHNDLPGFLTVKALAYPERAREFIPALDKGEAEAIALAIETFPDYLLIDDFAAREVAIAKGLPVIGLLGVLIRAKREAKIGSLAGILTELENRAGFRLSAELKRQALAAVGEVDS
jgi:uncharacterized protein